VPFLPPFAAKPPLSTMTNAEDIARLGKRFVKTFWDPMPHNDDTSGAPIWCLGRRYDSSPPSDSTTSPANPPPNDIAFPPQDPSPNEIESKSNGTLITHIDNQDGGWPAPFLDDFESRIWFTYRSSFPPIPKAQDPSATAALSFAVRLRSQLMQPDGFTSDTGWGCMIRSGQSLLANALFMAKLGRGIRSQHVGYLSTADILSQIGDSSSRLRKSAN
jgi:cysteine protease ATG4